MARDPLFPPSKPLYARQMAVGDGHLLYVEECAAVHGLPVLFLHGGPGSGCSPAQRRLFDPKRYRAIFVDQRGCGRSQPHGELEANTTAHLVADLEYLREALGIPAWIVFGGSWGSLLALTYAQIYPESVRGLVLRGIFLGTSAEIRTYVQGCNGTVPEAWKALPAPCRAASGTTCSAPTPGASSPLTRRWRYLPPVPGWITNGR